MKKIIKITIVLLIIHCTLGIELNAQVGINTDNSEPDVSAILDVKSTDKGMLIPRMDSTARKVILNPAIGLLVYDSTTTTFWYYDEMKWNEIRNGNEKLTATDILEQEPTTDFSCMQEIGNVNIASSLASVAVQDDYAYIVDQGGDKLDVVMLVVLKIQRLQEVLQLANFSKLWMYKVIMLILLIVIKTI